MTGYARIRAEVAAARELAAKSGREDLAAKGASIIELVTWYRLATRDALRRLGEVWGIG